MEEITSEQQGGNSDPSTPRDLAPREHRVPKSDFEVSLFRDGVYHFDFDKDANELNMDLASKKEWFDENPGWDERRTAQDMVWYIDSANFSLVWRQQFSDRIPRRWLFWYYARDDFEEAGKRGIQLSEELVTAGVTHPHHLTAKAAGESQQLNTDQLIAVLAHPTISGWVQRDILDAQKRMGLSEKDLREAQRRAEEIKERMKKARKRKKQIKSPLPKLSNT